MTAADNKPPLRIGLLLNDLTPAAWVAQIIRDIQDSGFARIELVVLNDAPAPGKPSLAKRLKNYRERGLYNLYSDLDARRNRELPDPFDATEVTPALGQAKIIRVRPQQKGFTDRFSQEDVQRVREHELDVIFRFGFRIIRGEILQSARYGVWSFHHDDNRYYRGAPPSFWEMYERTPVAGSILQVLTDSLDGGKVLCRSLSATNFDSLYATRRPLYWKTAQFAMRRLRDLHEHGWEHLASLETYNEAEPYTRGIYKTPGTEVMLELGARMAGKRIRTRARSLLWRHEQPQWFIALRKRQRTSEPLQSMEGFQIFLPPHDRFYADPDLVNKGGRNFLFFEDYLLREGRAVISCAELTDFAEIGEPRVVLERPYHLSYPFVFEDRGEMYMMPESRANSTIELYRATEFPYRWEPAKVLMRDVAAVDATLFEHEGKLWLFANMAAGPYSTCDELWLFSADSLEGEWRPHPRNPIVSDVTRARPAGRLFRHGGKLIRPSQDCSVSYGHAIQFNEVVTLNESDYRERPLHRVGPDWMPGNLGTHTYTFNEDFEAVDGNFRWPRRLLRPFYYMARAERRIQRQHL